VPGRRRAQGYDQRAGDQPGIIGCGSDGSQSGHHALRAAQGIAAARGVRLRVIRVFNALAGEVPLRGVPMVLDDVTALLDARRLQRSVVRRSSARCRPDGRSVVRP
jgi:hypothetical protein